MSQRRETWTETVTRVMQFLRRDRDGYLTGAEWLELEFAMQNLEVMPSMRIVQMAGPSLERCSVGAYNCAYTAIDAIDSFAEILYILMQGTGIGYSVEDRYVNRLPRIKKQKKLPVDTYLIPDSTEGWCDALKHGLNTWFDGRDVVFDYSQIRDAGTVLRTKGGRASGPQPLRDLLNFVRETVLAKQTRRLTPLNCHDIACYCGYIVQVGGVRRAALISLSDLYDTDLAECKNGEFWKRFPYRSMANNSAAYEEKPSSTDFMEEWLNLAKSGTGERGIFNRELHIPARRKRADFGLNPCGEITLRSKQFCNLSIVAARDTDTVEDLERKVRIAAYFGTIQSTLTHFPYLSDTWKKNSEDERLLGVDITGQRDCHLFNGAASSAIFTRLRHAAVETNRKLSERIGINPSVSVTCVKPSGNSSQLLDCASGLHVRYSPYYIRRVRTGAYTPVARFLKDAGVPYFPETAQDAANPTVLVFEFPVKAPDGAVCRGDVTARDQFNYWLDAKKNYTEHSASCTIYVEDHEWMSLGAAVYENWDKISGLSFLPKDHHIYPLAPYSEITKLQYEARVACFPKLDWSKLVDYEKSDETTLALEYGCTSGQCEL